MKKHIETPKGRYTYTFHPVYPGIKPIGKQTAKENLLLLRKTCYENEVNFILFFGTLLGALREHDFITHDEDIDLVLLKEDMPRFLSLLYTLREQGFEVIRFEERGFLSIMRKGEYIDLYFMAKYPTDNNLRYLATEICNSEYVEERCSMEFMGETFYVPRNSIAFLEFYYGKEWRTPVHDFNFQLSKTQVAKEFVKQYIKAILPDSWVSNMQSKHDAAELSRRLKLIGRNMPLR